MNATNVWYGNRQWPSVASPGAFAKDVFRIEQCANDKQKALQFFKWFQRCMCVGPAPKVSGLGGLLETNNPATTFAWGFHSCPGYGWVATEALQAAGLKARRVVHNNSTHTIYEVWYRGDNGVEGWHAFDAEFGWYFLNDDGEVASCSELAANPDLVIHPRGGSSRFGNYPERTLRNYPFRTADSLDINQPLINDSLSYQLQVGQRYETVWRPELPRLCWSSPDYPHGAHCDISMYDETGRFRYPEHAPYWKNYVWPTTRYDSGSGGQPVRWHACGALRWQPLLYGEPVVWRSDNAVFENGAVRPSGANKHCEVWWHFKLPFLATYLQLSPVVNAGGGDSIGFSISQDAGKSLHSLHWGRGEPPKTIINGPRPIPAGGVAQTTSNPSDGPTIRGQREFWLRLDMSGKGAAGLQVLSLGITVGFQLNMQTLPRLVPGDNRLYIKSDTLDNARLKAEWVYSTPQGQQVSALELNKSGETERTVDPRADSPEAIVMQGASLYCLPV